jgi:chemotaxis protein methyltransferase CheR
MDDRDFVKFQTLIQQRTGIHLRDGKHVMLASRLIRRLRHHGVASFSEYYGLLTHAESPASEMVDFINCVTTNKTSFFRESHHFDFLANTLLPEMKKAGTSREIRIWSAACSTGEEPYSIAIALLEALRRIGSTWDVNIVASDIDTAVLGKAQRGVYPIDALATIETAAHARYFLRGKGDASSQVKVKPELAGHIQFKRINLIETAWPIEGLFDGIFFRNALIYFDQPTQNLFLRKMLRHLRPGGYLFLGHSEHVPWLSDAVEPLSQTIYRMREPNGRTRPHTQSERQVPECRQ